MYLHSKQFVEELDAINADYGCVNVQEEQSVSDYNRRPYWSYKTMEEGLCNGRIALLGKKMLPEMDFAKVSKSLPFKLWPQEYKFQKMLGAPQRDPQCLAKKLERIDFYTKWFTRTKQVFEVESKLGEHGVYFDVVERRWTQNYFKLLLTIGCDIVSFCMANDGVLTRNALLIREPMKYEFVKDEDDESHIQVQSQIVEQAQQLTEERIYEVGVDSFPVLKQAKVEAEVILGFYEVSQDGMGDTSRGPYYYNPLKGMARSGYTLIATEDWQYGWKLGTNIRLQHDRMNSQTSRVVSIRLETQGKIITHCGEQGGKVGHGTYRPVNVMYDVKGPRFMLGCTGQGHESFVSFICRGY